ncbi:hypothetical protein ALC62_00091 [Cyphomyrmex costatus]|uniref:Uncharacterized protein n=1 Tax=Cyphomyrmex costatus TaxID=456900 RepID=A0A151K222_9HYME|nr:hypothetical protein ALC62_00091 [Cyphomyrmex costatus]
MELIDKNRSHQDTSKQSTAHAKTNKVDKKVNVATAAKEECEVCTGQHRLFKCAEFIKLSVPARTNKIKQLKLCINSTIRAEQKDNLEIQEELNVNMARKNQSQIILSTAQVLIEDANGERHLCRALLDPGSQTNVITKTLVNKMKYKTLKTSKVISGINNERVNYTEMVRIRMRLLHIKFEAEMECIVMPYTTEQLLQVRIDIQSIPITEKMKLADPEFHEPSNIDLLIGAGLF